MLVRKLMISYILLILLISTGISYTVLPDSNNPSSLIGNYSYKQEINLPIKTDKAHAIYQPIDIIFEFSNPCWAKDEKEHSIRVLYKSGNEWHHLESQIYNLVHSDKEHIKKCGLVFLIPEIANGKEKYYVFYDENKKNRPEYVDHVSVQDAYYYYEPISGVSAEGDYYKIIEDGNIVYGVGQKGKAIYRWLSQVILKQKPGTKDFGLLNSDDLVSFGFSYNEGVEDKDEKSSDQVLVSKGVSIDGNLMTEFKIVSESYDKNLRTTNYYKYYYCPGEAKRICVRVKHQVLDNVRVYGIEDLDGRYGAIFSFKSTSEKIQKMRFGEILPYLHVSGEDGKLREYNMILNPEGKKREWVVSYLDDCDVGPGAWLSYDEGESGKAHGIIFSSNKNLIKSDTNSERDGIQIKVAEKEYLNVIGAEIDYATINFGRNSYEPGSSHDLSIPRDLLIEYDAEFYTTETGGYNDVSVEAEYFQNLVKHRQITQNESAFEDENIYTLTITPRLTGRFFSNFSLGSFFGLNQSKIYAELYKNDKLISSSNAEKPIIGAPKIKFPKIASGNYSVRVYRDFRNIKKSYIGYETVDITEDKDINIFCTWPKYFEIKTFDQNNNFIENVELNIYKKNRLVSSNFSKCSGEAIISAPFNFGESYILKAFYKGFKVYESEILMRDKLIDIELEVYDLKIDIKDKLGFTPGVDVKPYITSSQMTEKIQIEPEFSLPGKYKFKNLPKGVYELHFSYGSFSDQEIFNIPFSGESAEIVFNAEYNLNIELLGLRGNVIQNSGTKIDIYRENKLIAESVKQNNPISLPPGEYKINVYSKDQQIGLKNIVLTNDKEITIVTTIKSIIPDMLTILTIIFIVEMIVLLLIKKITLNSFLKLVAMAFIIFSLVQPWWFLDASTDSGHMEKHSEMFIIPQVMIETVKMDNSEYHELATIPEVFTDFLGLLLTIVVAGFILLGISFIPNILYKRRFYKILISSSILFLLLVSIAYFIGMSAITEISLGALQGEGILEVNLPNNNVTYMNATWGLGMGFYFCIFSALIAMFAGISDFLRKKIFKKLKF
jgi:hypothetical protein